MSTYPIIKCAMCNRSLHEDMERNARIATLEAALAAATKRAEEAETKIGSVLDTARLCAARLSNAYDRMDLAEVTKNPWLASAITHAIQDLQATNSPAALAEAAQQAKKENGNGN